MGHRRLQVNAETTVQQTNTAFHLASRSRNGTLRKTQLKMLLLPQATTFDGEMKKRSHFFVKHFFVVDVESSFTTSVVSYLSPGVSFCSVLNVSHASHGSLSNSALWSSGASICSAVVFYSICLCAYVCLVVCMQYVRRQKAALPHAFACSFLLHRCAPPAAVELVISGAGWRAMETKSTDVTSPPGCVLTENIISTPLWDCKLKWIINGLFSQFKSYRQLLDSKNLKPASLLKNTVCSWASSARCHFYVTRIVCVIRYNRSVLCLSVIFIA